MKKTVCIILSAIAIFLNFSITASADSAACSVVINGDTGEILYRKNENRRVPMASTTKIMTALILCEKVKNLEKRIKVSSAALPAEGSSIYLKAGDEVSCKDLLYGMLLASGNDAANAAACAVSGSIKDFVSLMNKKAEQLNLKSTHFATPSGLDGKNHYTTAYDLAMLTKAALKNKSFAEACSKKTVTLTYGTPEKSHTFENHNRLLREYDDIIGVKTGYTKAAGRCLVSAARQDGMYLIAVTLNDKNDWADHRELLNGGYETLKNNRHITDESFAAVPLSSGGSIKAQIPKISFYSAKRDLITAKAVTPAIVFLPVEKGEKIGYVYYYSEYRCIKRLSLYAPNNIKEEKYSAFKKILAVFYAAVYEI